MSHDLTKAFKNPDGNRAEWRMYISHKAFSDPEKCYYVGDGVESMEYANSVESEEKKTIAQRQPTVTNKDGGLTVPVAFSLTKGSVAYDAILHIGLMGAVNESFDALLVYGNLRVKEDGTLIPDACFAHKAKMEFTVSSFGGAGGETIMVTSEGKTDGDISRGYVSLGTGGENYDMENETWNMAAFTAKDFTIGEITFGE